MTNTQDLIRWAALYVEWGIVGTYEDGAHEYKDKYLNYWRPESEDRTHLHALVGLAFDKANPNDMVVYRWGENWKVEINYLKAVSEDWLIAELAALRRFVDAERSE